MPASLIAVVGSVTPPGRLRRAVAEAVERSPAASDLLDLADVDLPFADGRPPAEAGGDLDDVIDRLEASDAVLVATPVYRGSLTGALKNLLDLAPVEALEGKAVAIAAMGASPHHFLGADRHLRDVLGFFGSRVTPVSAYLTSKDFEDGVPTAKAASTLDHLLADLEALRSAPGNGSPGALRPLAAAQVPPRQAAGSAGT